MNGTDVYRVLQGIGAVRLHHANSVTTSGTFLEQGGLASRGFVEDRRLKQTSQNSDTIDKRYAIWHRVFVDHVDIHHRGGRRRGPNLYGPVLFWFELDTLLGLPEGTDVLITKTNPVHWFDNQPDTDRYFQSVEELAEKIQFGDFDKMLVIYTPTGKLDFLNRRARIILDDPKRQLSSGKDAYVHAKKRLIAAAGVGGVETTIERRYCPSDCICVTKYAAWQVTTVDFYFG